MGWDMKNVDLPQTSPIGDEEISADCFGLDLEDLDPFKASRESFRKASGQWANFDSPPPSPPKMTRRPTSEGFDGDAFPPPLMDPAADNHPHFPDDETVDPFNIGKESPNFFSQGRNAENSRRGTNRTGTEKGTINEAFADFDNVFPSPNVRSPSNLRTSRKKIAGGNPPRTPTSRSRNPPSLTHGDFYDDEDSSRYEDENDSRYDRPVIDQSGHSQRSTFSSNSHRRIIKDSNGSSRRVYPHEKLQYSGVNLNCIY